MNSKEFVKALKNICEEKQISEDVIFEGMTTALEKAYAKETGLPSGSCRTFFRKHILL